MAKITDWIWHGNGYLWTPMEGVKQDGGERKVKLWCDPTKPGQPTGFSSIYGPSELSTDGLKCLGLFTLTVISHWANSYLWESRGVRLSSAEANFAGADHWSSLLTNFCSWNNSPSLRKHLGSTSYVYHSPPFVPCKSILNVCLGGSSPGL